MLSNHHPEYIKSDSNHDNSNHREQSLVVTINYIIQFFQINAMLFFDRQVGEWNYERTESKVFFPIQRLFDSHASLQRI